MRAKFRYHSDMDRYMIRPIAHIRSDYNEKFGIPRQAGLVSELEQAVIIDPEFSNIDAVRGLQEFSRIWLIWGFSRNAVDMETDRVKWSPTVRPPRLKGKVRKGVWATRSPYRPNSLGLSNVRLLRIMLGGKVLYDAACEAEEQDLTAAAGYIGPENNGAYAEPAENTSLCEAAEYIAEPERLSGETAEELVLIVSGADMMDGTPVYDIKPYIPYSDSHPGASRGYTGVTDMKLRVEFPNELLEIIDENKRNGLISVLELDPRGAYEKKDGYSYGMSFGRWDVRFTVEGDLLTVTEVIGREERII